jgi:hypothetical protein
MANAYDKRFLLLKRACDACPAAAPQNQPIARSTCCISIWPTTSSRPNGNILRSKYGRTLSQPFDKPREDYHGSIIARGEAKSPDSLRRHKRYCRESNFEVFQPFRMANASSSARKKYYQLFSNVDTETPRFPGL